MRKRLLIVYQTNGLPLKVSMLQDVVNGEASGMRRFSGSTDNTMSRWTEERALHSPGDGARSKESDVAPYL